MVWNTQMKFWEHYKESQLFEHLEPFLGTWPTSGTMLDGQVYELVMQEHHTSVSESLLLRTPVASEAEGGAVAPEVAKANGQTLRLSGQMIDLVAPNQLPKLPTPVAQDVSGAMTPEARANSGQGYGPALRDIKYLIGTPRGNAANSSQKQVKAGAPKGRIEDQVKLFPTLRASDSYERRNQKTMDRIARDGGDMTMTTLARTTTDWGKFEPAIRRWEAILDRPAPEPTKPDGKEANHRLSSKFTEWMMGLPDGWITGIGLKRNDELKACGNGVVPQQAELALSLLGIKEIIREN
jgi:DNA (cytosine-5)-methyltransferase 1